MSTWPLIDAVSRCLYIITPLSMHTIMQASQQPNNGGIKDEDVCIRYSFVT